MKMLITSLALFALVLGFTLRAAQQNRIKQVTVTPQTFANQPAGQPYILDLSRGGTIYDIAKEVDSSRIHIRTSEGEFSMSELTRKHPGPGRWMFGMANDMRTQVLEPGSRKISTGGTGATAGFVNCDAGINPECHCVGWRDCIGLALAKTKCEIWSCSFLDPASEPFCTCRTPKQLN